jgi:16S rRNA (cytosine967-C5)-methyltransferase
MARHDTKVASTRPSAVTEPRLAAAAVLRDLRGGALLDAAFEAAGADLDARDRRWLREAVYTTLRRRAWIDAVLDARVRGGLSRVTASLADLLRLGVTQLLFMDSVPAYAAIAQTVEQAKALGIGASRLVNAVLRRVDRERDALEPPLPADPLDAMALVHSHPRWLVARWAARWGAEETRRLLEANNAEAHTVLRPYGLVREQLEAMLEHAGVPTFEPPLSPDGIAVAHGVPVTALGVFQQGHCFVQDPGATMVARYAAVPPGATITDLCAAPGGKAFELSRTAGCVVACDAVFARAARIADSVRRMAVPNVYPVVADARRPCVRPTDVVLLDAPCTGTGTFRRHPDARWRLKPSDLAVMAAVQRTLLDAAAAVVRPGGLLVYSTCSLEVEENDEQVEAFLASHADFALDPPAPGTVPDAVLDAGRLRVLPHVHGVDGAFAARLRRRAA